MEPLPLLSLSADQRTMKKNGATSAESSSTPAKRSRPSTLLKSWMAYTTLKSLLNVRKEIISLRFPTQRNSRLSLVLIVAKKNVKNIKNCLDKKNRRRMNTINANKENFLNKREERWRERDIISNNIKGLINRLPPPHRTLVVVMVVVDPLIITQLLKTRLIFRPRK